MSFSDKHIFFDLDRTLWDFDENSKEALRQIIKRFDLMALFGSFDRFHRAYEKHNSRLWADYGKGILKKESGVSLSNGLVSVRSFPTSPTR